MTSYEKRLRQAITFDSPDEIPVSVSILPAAWMKCGKELAGLAKEYPEFIPVVPDYNNPNSLTDGYTEDYINRYQIGDYVDEWGCVWSSIYAGMDSLVTKHPVPSREDILHLQIPENRNGNLPHGFMYLRLLDLRGFEEAMVDFAEECEELQILIDKVVEYNCYQVQAILPKYKKGDLVMFGDDLGMQHSLAIGAEKWRKYLKPAFQKIYAPLKEKGCLIYMHTDGYILDIMPDLVECGVDIINPQSRANGIEGLVRVCKGKIPIDLDLDRQLFPFATPSQIDDHIRECVESLYLPEGGLALKAELNYEIPLNNIVAIFEALNKYKKYSA